MKPKETWRKEQRKILPSWLPRLAGSNVTIVKFNLNFYFFTLMDAEKAGFTKYNPI